MMGENFETGQIDRLELGNSKDLESVGGAGLVISQAEPAVFHNEVGTCRQGDCPGGVNIVHLDPQDREVSHILN